MSFSELEYELKKVTRRDRFLDEPERVTPWSALVAEIEPYYPKKVVIKAESQAGQSTKRQIKSNCLTSCIQSGLPFTTTSFGKNYLSKQPNRLMRSYRNCGPRNINCLSETATASNQT